MIPDPTKLMLLIWILLQLVIITTMLSIILKELKKK